MPQLHLVEMGDPNCCHALIFGNLLALSRWKERDWQVVAASVQWVFQKLQPSKNRLIPQKYSTNEKNVQTIHLDWVVLKSENNILFIHNHFRKEISIKRKYISSRNYKRI